MKIKKPDRFLKKKIRLERARVLEKMSDENVSQKDWEDLNKRLMAYNEMLQTTWKIPPETIFVVTAQLLGPVVILICNNLGFIDKMALNFKIRGRV